jgi:hypothetical protein
MSKTSKIGLWELLENAVVENRLTTSSSKSKPKDSKKVSQKEKYKRWFLFADITSTVLWLYLITKIFLFDIDLYVASNANVLLLNVVYFKFVWILLLVFLLAAFFWKLKTLGLIVYILSFPLIVIFWKIPRWIYKSKSVLVFMAFMNAILLLARHFRYNLISKSIGIISIILISFVNIDYLTFTAATLLLILLVISFIRTLWLAFQSDWFLDLHERFINKVIDSEEFLNFIKPNDDVLSGELKKLKSEQYSSITLAVNTSILVNKGMLFWAHQLKRYTQKNIAAIFNGFSFLWLLLGTIIVFWFINIAIFSIYPEQFNVAHSGSRLAFLVYSISTLYSGESAGIIAVGDLSLLSNAGATLFGSIFLLTIAFNFFFLAKQSNSEKRLNTTIAILKSKAKLQEDTFKGFYDISLTEAQEKLEKMNESIYAIVAIILAKIPTDFEKDI